MTRSIGRKCKDSNVLSSPVLIGRGLDLANPPLNPLSCAAFNVQTPHLHKPTNFSGAHSGGETPVPIPNTAVKPSSADGTARATGRESRSVPGMFLLRVFASSARCRMHVLHNGR